MLIRLAGKHGKRFSREPARQMLLGKSANSDRFLFTARRSNLHMKANHLIMSKSLQISSDFNLKINTSSPVYTNYFENAMPQKRIQKKINKIISLDARTRSSTSKCIFSRQVLIGSHFPSDGQQLGILGPTRIRHHRSKGRACTKPATPLSIHSA